ncbi:hypothetical protein JMF89_01495 [Clostridiaceae bacterium UIB06]|uniref:DNA helicase n=1 Tax=Clostridium thailandense TaxID=2794346 RepID=A0A949TH76_9CLOT|nr:AAA domain-containing protein [Clostridium thailandense]MBV7272724.1 hypothetical protein [Clostridium thailandense]MCH5135890.1 hypothetical protein [Clostridiaceae bacterium UIB06]
MDYKNKVRQVFSYLLNVKNLSEKIIRTIWDYESIYWEEELCKAVGCIVNRNNSREFWLEVSKKNKPLYEQFFKFYLELQKRSESMEIVWGHGLIAWNFNNENIIHPLLTTRMRLDFNAVNNVFRLIPEGKTIVEANIFEGIDIPNAYSILNMEKKVKKINIDPRNLEQVEEILIEIASYLSPNGKFEEKNTPFDKIVLSNEPIIYNTPVVLMRKNNMRLWQLEVNSIINGIDNGQPIPETVKALVIDKKIEQDKEVLEEWKSVNKDILFPLPANYEQREVVKRICENYGVVMQGPPGTGKSHTIANLICHLLAHGKKVLVTSRSDKALKILFDKIPEQIRPLCMSVLGNDIESLKKLNETVKKISDNLSVNPENLYEEIKELKAELDNCRRKENNLYNKFKEIQMVENETIRYDNQQYKIMDMITWIKNNEERYSWIEDEISLDKKMPISEIEFERLTFLLSKISKEEKKNFDRLSVMVDKLPAGEGICQKILRFKELNKEYEYYLRYIEGWRIPSKNNCNYDKLLQLLLKCKSSIQELKKGIFGDVFTKYYSSKIIHDSIIDLMHKGNEYMLMLRKIRNELRNHSIQLPENIDMDKLGKDFDILYESINSKKHISKFFKLTHPEYNYIIKECIVDHKALENQTQAFVLKLYIQEKFIVRDLKTLWNNTVTEYGKDLLNFNVNNLELFELENYIKYINNIVDWDKNYKREVIGALGKIITPENIDWHREESYDYLIECIKCIKNIDETNKLKAYIEILKKLILVTGNLENLYNAVESLDINAIKKALKDIDKFKITKGKYLELNHLISKLKLECPLTSSKILQQWDNAIKLFRGWSNAWKYAQWKTFIENTQKLNYDPIEEAISEEKENEKVLIKELVAKKTWYNQILKTTESKKRSLFAWMQAVKRIGKGTGKMTADYRRIAQEEMEKCKEIIPVWIMPLNRIIENIKLSKDLFDVIIFDESSQCDIFSICALMRAKKAIIVGDDRQICPETIGVDQSFIQGLINKHLRTIPHREWFDLQTSLYDTALRVFPNRLMLKEHFRCVPEIISFSNELCYSGDIRPLRYRSCCEAVYPPIVTVRIKDGLRELGKPINLKEAEYIVNKIVECCENKLYEGMTMGVISLLGEAQGELIENMIRERISEEEIIKRKLICGDAYSFQGDERDIMFLSMVISNNVKFTALTKESDIRRFNVAASRARNQMWLIHSIELEDLNSECVRYYLLNYCLNYDKLDRTYKDSSYIVEKGFKKEVYIILKEKGFNVVPQVRLGKYKIDFVLEGLESKAAIVCDTGESNENHNWEEYLEIKLDLERIGWTFFRIRCSEFYYNHDKTIDKLLRKLKNIGIEQYKNSNLIEEQLKVV